MSNTPTFTDIDGRKIICRLSNQNDFEYLEIDELLEDGSLNRLMTLNMYDAKKLNGATEMFMARTIAKNFADLSGHLSAAERGALFDD